MTPSREHFIDAIRHDIEKRLREIVEEEFDRLKEEYLMQLERRKAAEVSGILIALQHTLNIQDLGSSIQIIIGRKDVK